MRRDLSRLPFSLHFSGSVVGHHAGLRLKPAAAAVAFALLGLNATVLRPAHANPTGAQLTAGAATVQQPNATTVLVTQTSNRAALNWQSFSIAAGESVIFRQPSSSAVALNRVVGPDPSAIYGSLQANGHVVLINPSGVLFGRGASVDVGGLVASTLGLSNADFMAGRYAFTGDGRSGSVVNEGRIKVSDGSHVVLLGAQVVNRGTIVATNGSVALGAGENMLLDLHGDGLVTLKVNGAAAGARIGHSGLITADGGQVIMSVRAKEALIDTVLNVEGIVLARGAVERNGAIYLEGGASGVTRVTGILDASSTMPGRSGGDIRVLGDLVALQGNARLDASGAGGGGTVLVGGDFQGRNPALANARRTFVGSGASIFADATASGDGGKVIVWSDDYTAFNGSISARGGAQGGNGGFVEVSGKQGLGFNGVVDLAAPAGRAGTLLLDPLNIIVIAGLGADDGEVSGDGQVLFGDRPADALSIGAAAISAFNGTVELQATNDITVNAAIVKTGNNGLTFRAGNDININAAITVANGSVILTANDGAGGTASGAGAVKINAALTSTGVGFSIFNNSSSNANRLGSSINAGTGGVAFFGAVDLTAPSSVSGGSGVAFNGAINGGFALEASSAQAVNFFGAVGVTTPLASLATSGAGTTLLAGNSVITTGSQSYANPVKIGAFTAVTSTDAGDITFANTLNGGSGLSVNTAGSTTFSGVVGGVTPLSSLSTDAPGTTVINTSAIKTTSSQTYNDPITLASNVTLSSTGSGLIRLLNTLDGAFSLDVNSGGFTTFGGVIGGMTPLTSLTTNALGQTQIATTGVTTSGAQTYGDRVSITANAVLTSMESGTISFKSSVDGPGGLKIVTAGAKVFDGAVGASGPLNVLLIEPGGSVAMNGGSVTTVSSQNYASRLVLGADTTFTTTAPFDMAFNDVQGGFAMTVNSGGVTKLGTIGNITPLASLTTDAAGMTTFEAVAGVITTSGSQTFGDSVRAVQAYTLTGSTITFASTLDRAAGANLLSVNAPGDKTFAGAVGGIVPLGSLMVSGAGPALFGGGGVTTSGAQTYNSPVKLTDNAVMTSTESGAISFKSTLDGPGGLQIVTAGAKVFDAAVGATAPLNVLLIEAGGSIAMNAGSVTTVSSQKYDSALLLGADTAFTTVGAFDTFFTNVQGGFAMTVNSAGVTKLGTIGDVTRLASLTTDGAGMTTFEAVDGVIATTGGQTFGDPVRAAQAYTLSGSAITFASTLDRLAGANLLSVNAPGDKTFAGAVGGIVPLGSLMVSGAGRALFGGGGVTTSGAQSYNSPVKLTDNAVMTSMGSAVINFNSTVDGPGGLQIVTGGKKTFIGAVGATAPLNVLLIGPGGSVAMNGGSVTTVSSQNYESALVLGGDTTFTTTGAFDTSFTNVQGGFAMTVNSAGVTKLGTIGDVTRLASLTTDAAGMTTFEAVDGVIATTGGQTFGDPVRAVQAYTLSGSAITFASTLDRAGGTNLLSVNAPGDKTFAGAVGGIVPLGSLMVSGAGPALFGGGVVTTSGGQRYNSPVKLTNNAVMTTTGPGGINFQSTLDGAFDLTLNTAGATSFGGAVGSTAALASLTTDAPGTTQISGGVIRTTGSQVYNDAVMLGADATLSTVGAGALRFESTVDGPYALTANSGRPTRFSGEVGGAAPLASLTTDSGGTTVLSQSAASAITTSGNQTYGDPVHVAGNYTLRSTAGNITFGSTIDGSLEPGAVTALTVTTDGVRSFAGAIGSNAPLGSFSIEGGGSAVINGGSVTTTGSQGYARPLTLGANTIFTSTDSGSLIFRGVDGAFDFTANTAGLTSLGNLAVASVTTDAPGMTSFSSLGSITTSGSQSYSDAVSVSGNRTLTSTAGGYIAFLNTVDGDPTPGAVTSLTLTTDGVKAIIGAGSTTPLGSLKLGGSGKAVLGASVTTTGDQTYNSPLLIAANMDLTSTGAGAINFMSTVDGAFDLSVHTDGTRLFSGAVGGITPLSSFRVVGGGSAAIDGGSVTTTGLQQYARPLTLGANTTFTSTDSGSLSFRAVSGPFDFKANTAGETRLGSLVVGSVATDTGGTTDFSSTLGHVISTGSQSYADAVNVGGDLVLTSTAGGAILFARPVNGDPSPGAVTSLTVTTDGLKSFSGIGGTTPLGSLKVAGSGKALLHGAIMTTGNQTYNSPLSIAANIEMTSTGAGAINFTSTVDGAFDLAVNTAGVTSFGGAVGTAAALALLTTDAPGVTQIGGGVIRTTGSQHYNDAVMLGADATLSTVGAGALRFESTVDGPYALIANSGRPTRFSGEVGGTAPLASLTTDSGGTTVLNQSAGSAITTSGNQTYGDPVVIAGNYTLRSTAGNITFGSTINAQDPAIHPKLAVQAPVGTVTFSGSIGNIAPLGGLSVVASPNTIVFNASDPQVVNVSTEDGGTVSFESNVVLGQSLTVNAPGANIVFGAAINADAPNTNPTLDLLAGSGTVSLQNVGNKQPIGALTVGGSELDLNANVQVNGGGSVDFTNVSKVVLNSPVVIATDAPGGSTAAGSVRFNPSGTIEAANPQASLTLNVTADGGGASGAVLVGPVTFRQSTSGFDTAQFASGLLSDQVRNTLDDESTVEQGVRDGLARRGVSALSAERELITAGQPGECTPRPGTLSCD